MERNQKPLIHNITHYVVMNTTANALLSMVASPVVSAIAAADDPEAATRALTEIVRLAKIK